jgi:hypothetical protein
MFRIDMDKTFTAYTNCVLIAPKQTKNARHGTVCTTGFSLRPVQRVIDKAKAKVSRGRFS